MLDKFDKTYIMHQDQYNLPCEIDGCPNRATKIPVMRLYSSEKDLFPSEASMDMYVCEAHAVGDARLFIFGDKGWDQIISSCKGQGMSRPVRELTRMKFLDIPKVKEGRA